MNYCAIIAKITKVEPISGADRIQAAYVMGECVVVGKDVKVGDVGVFFPPDTQISEEYLSDNGLYRDSSKNKNPESKGFFEDNGRVRAQPFLGIKSSGYFASLSTLAFTGYDLSKLEVGMMFEDLNGVHIAKKYVNPRTLKAQSNQKTKARKKMETPLFHEHVDTDQFKYHAERIPAGSIISIQAKRHGTSGRASHTLVKRELPKWKQLINKLVPVFAEESWEYVTGTRRVVLKQQDSDKEGFHGSEGFRFEILEQLKPHLERGITVYYEILGYANGKPIMPPHDITKLKDKEYTKKYGKVAKYAYGCTPDEYKFFIYRVTHTTLDGTEIDLTQPQLKHWCDVRGLESTFDVVDPFVYDGDVEKLRDMVEHLTERPDVLTEDYTCATQISEGVIVRVDSGTFIPKFYKNKSYAFRLMEGIAHDDGVVDTEEENS